MSDRSEQAAFAFPSSSAADSPARTSHSQDPEKASTASARAFGASTPGSFVSFDHASSSWKTSPRSDDEASETFSGTWPRAGTMRRGIACPQPPSARLTAGTGCSWSRGEYPTPTASRHYTTMEGTASLHGWATGWPTPTKSDAVRGSGTYKRGNPTLTGAARASSSRAAQLWPTPPRGDAKSSGSRVGNPETQAHPGTSLTDASCRSGLPLPTTCTHGEPCRPVLNPRFVEWLMSFPIGWLSLPRSETLSLPL